MGPHGLVIGATGSGKSELLRTLVLGLALTHSSDVLNFVLVDFKGGATFLGLDRLTHVSAVITNLADELPLVDRMRDALTASWSGARSCCARRATTPRCATTQGPGRRRGAGLPPVPTLFVVIDEFSELLSAKPEFIDLFVMIGRLGRSLGVHLLLASQRLEEGKLRGSTRTCPTGSACARSPPPSRASCSACPTPTSCPPQPGSGYLKFDTGAMTRFKAAYVSGPASTGADPAPQRRVQPVIVPYGPGYVRPEPPGRPAAARPGAARRVAGAEPARRRGRAAGRRTAPAAHQIWLPPLDVPPTLDSCCPRSPITRTAGCTVDERRMARPGFVPVTRDRGPAVRAAPRPAVGGPVRRPRATRRWSARRGAASPPCCGP